jgi:hypothetical protein
MRTPALFRRRNIVLTVCDATHRKLSRCVRCFRVVEHAVELIRRKLYKLRETRSVNHAIGKQQEIMGFIPRDMLRSPKLHLIWYNLGDLVLLCTGSTLVWVDLDMIVILIFDTCVKTTLLNYMVNIYK